MIQEVLQGRIQDFKLWGGGGGGALNKIAPSGGRRELFWGISCEKSRFYAKKIIFFPIAEGGAKIVGVFCVKNHDFTPKNHIFQIRGAPTSSPPPPPPPGSAPVLCVGSDYISLECGKTPRASSLINATFH